MTVKTDAEACGLCNQTIRTDIVVVLDGDCDLGWSRSLDGSFALVANLRGVAKNHNVTNLINALNQKYAVNKTLAALKRPGLQQANVQISLQK
jgi:hypothetical protein